MRRQEFLVNLTLITVIGSLVYFIYKANDDNERDIDIPRIANRIDKQEKQERVYNVASVDAKYRKFGTIDLFKPLLTPTPPPPPETPPPTPTPDINAALSRWKVEGIMDGEAMVVDTATGERWNMKVGESRQIEIRNEPRNVKVTAVDETSDDPSAIFQWDEPRLIDKKTLKLIDDATAPPSSGEKR